MRNSSVHKFQRKIPITYEDHFRKVYANFVSFLRTLEEEIGKERSLEILTKWSEQRIVKMAGNRRVASFAEFKEYWKNTSAEDFFLHTSTTEFPEETDMVLQCKIIECLWAKTFQELNAAELGKIMVCDPDFSFASTVNPKLRLKRTKTLMEGHDCCDHRYVWEE